MNKEAVIINHVKSYIMGSEIICTIFGYVGSFLTDKTLNAILGKIMPSVEKRAFSKAVKRWSPSLYIRGYYKEHRIKCIEEFCEYVKSHQGTYNNDIDSLYRLFEEELDKTTEGRLFLQNLRLKKLNKDQYEVLMKTADILNDLKKHYDMLRGIEQVLNSHNKGIREFTDKEDYIQRYCTRRLNNDEYFKYLLEHKTIEKKKLIDFISERTECKGNKFILYSDAQTGKTTELKQLGWELQKEGQFIPIMFQVKGCYSIKQELPALSPDIEEGLVGIIDALDEKFEGDARFSLYNEIETYAAEHPHLKMILTCRENFSSEFSFEEFTALTLSDLSWEETENFLKERGIEHIVADIENHRLYEFARTPFYLIALSNYYKEKHELPENKGELYNYFIDQRLKQEDALGLKENSEMSTTGKSLLQKMAVAMQLRGYNQISKDELLYLFDKHYLDYSRVLRSGLIEIGEEGKYEFTHNSFKEYFVAQYLLTLGNLEEIQRLCCYERTKIVRTGWNNTIALLLSQLPKESELCRKIVAWIVDDNKELVLYIDRKVLDNNDRIRIFIEILEWHKERNLRIADLGTSKYEDLMNFGRSSESIEYLMTELKNCMEINGHTVNILFLLQYVRYEDISEEEATELKKLLLDKFDQFKDDDEHVFVFFEVFTNPWLSKESTTDEIYKILQSSDNPNIVNHFVDFVTETKCAEKYVDVIIDKGKYIKSYNKDGYTRVLRKNNLYGAYFALNSWDSIQKVLRQLTDEFVQDLVAYTDEDDFDETLGKLLEKVSKMTDEHPEAPDFVYEMLLEMAEGRISKRNKKKDIFLTFFDKVGLSQHYFDKSVNSIMDYCTSDKRNNNYDCQIFDAMCYCAGLFLNEERLDAFADTIDYKNPDGNCLLVNLSLYASEDMQKEIDIIRKNRYPKFWRDKNTLNQWQIEAQRDYDELMDYDRFKGKVLKIIEEKAPKNKAELNELRHVKIKMSDEDNLKISRYIYDVFQNHEKESDSYDLLGIKNWIEDYAVYQRMVVYYTEDIIYKDNNSIVINDNQRKLYRVSVVNWLKELSKEPYRRDCSETHPAISALLHHDVEIENDLLMSLLPYSSCKIHIPEGGFNSKEYCLFDYIEEHCTNKVALLQALRKCMDEQIVYGSQNWEKWCVYLVKNEIVAEYKRCIDKMLSLPYSHSSITIVMELLKNEETRVMILKDEVLDRCNVDMRFYIFGQLAKDKAMYDFVKSRVEKEFDCLDESQKRTSVRLLLMTGSMKGLKYAEMNPSIINIGLNIRGYDMESLPTLISLYSKAIDIQHHSEYGCVLHAIEEIAVNTNEGWNKVNDLFCELIMQDKKKFINLNWYLREWGVKRMEKAYPVMSLDNVKNKLKTSVNI